MKILILIIAITLPVIAQAIPLSVLRAQEQERENIERAMRTADKNCAECREQIAAALRHYIAGMQANIDFCARLLRTEPAAYRNVTAEAIWEYQMHREFARAALKQITERKQ
jgi:hypothetical protein